MTNDEFRNAEFSSTQRDLADSYLKEKSKQESQEAYEKDVGSVEKGGRGETGEGNKDDFRNAEFSSTQRDIGDSYLKETSKQESQETHEKAVSSVEKEKEE